MSAYEISQSGRVVRAWGMAVWAKREKVCQCCGETFQTTSPGAAKVCPKPACKASLPSARRVASGAYNRKYKGKAKA